MRDIGLMFLVQARNETKGVFNSISNGVADIVLGMRNLNTAGNIGIGAITSGVTYLKDAAIHIGNAFFQIGAAAAVAGTVVATKFGIESVKAAGEFQKSMLQSQSLAGVTAQEAKDASTAMMKMAVDTGQVPKVLASGFYDIASSSYRAKDSLTLLNLAAKGASIGNTETSITAKSLVAVMKSFNVPVSDASKIMDQMVKTVSTGRTEFADYAQVIGKVSLNAKQANVSFTEANAAFATLTNTMPSSKQAADSLNALLQTSSRYDLLTARADKLNISFDVSAYKTMNFNQRLQYLRDITHGNSESITKLLGRQNAATAMTALLTNNSKDYADALQGINHAQGATDTAMAKTQKGYEAQANKLHASVDVLKITIGSALLPVITKLVEKMTPIVVAFTNWITQSHVVENTVHTLSTAIGTLVVWISQTVTFFQKNQVAMAALQGVLITAALFIGGALVIAFVSWAIAAGGAAIATLIAMAPIIAIGVVIAVVIASIILIIRNWQTIWTTVWGAVVVVAQGAWGAITNGIHAAKEVVGKAINGIGNTIKNIFTQWPGMALQFGINLINSFISGITSKIGSVGKKMGEVWSTIASYFPHSPPKEGPGRDLPNWGPRLVTMFASDIESASPKAGLATEHMMSYVANAIQSRPITAGEYDTFSMPRGNEISTLTGNIRSTGQPIINNYNFSFNVPLGTTKQMCDQIAEYIDRKLGKSVLRQGTLTSTTSGGVS